MSESESPIVTVAEGQLRGRIASSPTSKPYYSFQGIPYAKPPLGSLRFQDPQPAEPWEDVRDATKEGNISAQLNIFENQQYVGDEDCLFLNVYSPKLEDKSLAVMVYIHGGAFVCGSGNSETYGPDFLIEQGVVIVTMNYRVGTLGFLCLNTPEVPGNAALKDVALALRWVKKNISNFGGNPDNITIFGESAGGSMVQLLTASPLTKDLISKAIIQSGQCLDKWAWQRRPLQSARALAKELGCESEDVDDILDFLREASPQAITEAYAKLNPLIGEKYAMAPVIEKEFRNVEAVITQPFIELVNSGKVADIPIMIGTADLEICMPPLNDDLKLLIPEDFNIDKESSEADEIADQIRKFYFKGQPISVENWYDYFDLLSDLLFKVSTNRYVKYLSKVTKQPIYVYAFDYYGNWNLGSRSPAISSLNIKRAVHTDELWYLFRNVSNDAVEGTNADKKIRERMVRLWTNFAKTGDPTPTENHYLNITWVPISIDNHYYLRITNELSLHTDPEKERMEFWDDMYNKYFKIWEQPKSNEDDIPINSRAFKRLILEETKDEHQEDKEEVKENGDLEPEAAKEESETVIEDEAIVVEEPKELIKSSDPPADDLPKNIGVDKFVTYYDSLGNKK